ncbi:MAG: hypothetical protein WCG10_00205 [Chlamydiota bacterium]
MDLKKLAIMMIMGSFAYGNVGTWTTTGTAITTSSQVLGTSDVFSCYIKRTNQIAFSWSDLVNKPTMIVYNAQNPSFSSLIQLANPEDTTSTQVYPTVDTGLNEVFLSLRDNTAARLIYDATYPYLTPSSSFSSFASIGRYSAYRGCFSCYNTKNGDMIFNWVDTTTGYSTFVTLNDSTGVLSGKNTISSSATKLEIVSCYNSDLNQVVFSWSISYNQQPYYAIYNGSYQQIALGPISSTYTAKDNVFCANNNNSNQTVFSFADNKSSIPYYAIYDHILNKITVVDAITQSSLVSNTVCCCHNSRLNQYVFSWRDLHTGKPYYAIYDVAGGSVVESGNIPPGSTVVNDVNCCYNHALNQVVFNWTGAGSAYPYYAIYTMPIPSHLQRGDLLDAVKYSNKVYLKQIVE